jgi:hypothetical protein
MQTLQDTFIEAVMTERERLISRRAILSGGLKLGAAGAVALAFAGVAGPKRQAALAQDVDFMDDLEVLNYALTLEHLEYAFYRDGIGQFSFGMDPFGNSIDRYLTQIRDHEGAHIETLTQVITDLGGMPVKEARYDFGYGSDPQKFLMTAAALENTGVMAYDGAGAALKNADLLVAAGTIVSVEARHAAYLNLVTGQIPFPDGFEQAKRKDEILEIAGPFIVG